MATSRTETAMYDLSRVVDIEALSSVSTGSAILVSGPAMSGTSQLVLDMVADGSRQGEGAIIVSTEDRAVDVFAEYTQQVPALDESRVGIVDCQIDGDQSGSAGPAELFTHHVSSPGDLTGMGIGITKSLEHVYDSGAHMGRLAVLSLSTMLTYTNETTICKFCHVLSARLDALGYLGLFTIDASAHDEQTLQVITQAVDGLIELREQQGTRQVRAMGITPSPTAWTEIRSENGRS